MSELEKNMVDYFVICINEFAKRYEMSPDNALIYLDRYNGLKFLEDFYDVQHTLSFDETVDNLTIICHNNGGDLS